MSFPERVLECRLKNKWTQKELAALLKVTRATVGMWENPKVLDEIIPRARTLERMAKLFNVTVHWLLFGESNDFQPKDYKMRVANPPETSIILAAPILKPDQIGGWLKSKSKILPKGIHMTQEEINDCIFRIEVEGDAMMSAADPIRSLIPGEILTVDPLCTGGIKSGDVVLVQYGMTDNYKARIFNVDGNDSYLSAINPNVPTIAVNDHVKIIGKVIASERKKSA